MSFLSRRSSRPDKDGGRVDAGRRADSEYDDYDYAPGDYQQDDDNWSPDEYFSPEGIKGRWAAGARPGERGSADVGAGGERGGGGERAGGERGGGRGRHSGGRDSARDSRSPRDSRDARDRDARDSRGGGRGYDGYDGFDSGPQGGRGPGGGYGRDAHQRDSYGPDRSYGPGGNSTGDYGSRDHGTGEYGSGEYATGAYDVTEDADGDRGERGGGGRRRRDRADKGDRGDRSTGAWRQRLGLRDKGDDIWPDDGVSDEDYWASVAADRPLTSTGGPQDAGPAQAADSRPAGRRAAAASGPGRLGPAPGLNSQSGQSGYLSASTPSGAHSRHGAGASTGPGSGPMARAATGPTPAVRPGTGPAPARPATGPGASRPGLPQPSFQPAAPRGAGEPAGSRGASRPPERPDWAERTERIDRVNASGYPDPRASGRVQMPAVSSSPAQAHAPARGRGDSPDRRMPDPREPGRTSSVWDGGGADDPLTSRAYSRSTLSDTDGRSYRAAHRSPVSSDRREAALTEQTQTFSMPQHQSDSQAPTAHYPAYGSQQTEPQPGQQPRQSSQPPRPQLPPSDGPGGGVGAMPGGARGPYERGTTASHPYSGQPYPARGGDQDSDRYGRAQQPGGYGTGGYSSGSYSGGGYDTGNYGAGADPNGNGAGYADNRRGGKDSRDTGGHRYNGYGDGGKRH